jgi:hypothetical protein
MANEAKRFLAFLLIVTLFLPGCAREKPVKELVIPSSLSSMEVVEEIFPANPMRFILGEDLNAIYLPEGACQEGFVGGYGEPFFGAGYTMRDGSPVNQSKHELPILDFKVFKYESTEFAQRSYDGIGGAYGFQNLTHRNIALKTAVQPASEYDGENYWGVYNLSFYVVESGCFIIFFYGHDDIVQDALDRVIDTFGV